jgi:hypothetical protein
MHTRFADLVNDEVYMPDAGASGSSRSARYLVALKISIHNFDMFLKISMPLRVFFGRDLLIEQRGA